MEESHSYKSWIYYLPYVFIYLFIYMPLASGSKEGHLSFIIISIICIIVNIAATIRINIRDSINCKDVEEYDYWYETEFPNIEPIHAGYILNRGKIDINGIIATIFLLEQKNIFKIEIINNKYYITLNKISIEDIEKLQQYEQKIVKFLFSNMNDENEIDLSKKIKEIKNNYEQKVIINNICKEEQIEATNRFYKFHVWDRFSNNKILFHIEYLLNFTLVCNIIFGIITTIYAFVNSSVLAPFCLLVYIIQIAIVIQNNSFKTLKHEYLDEARKLNGLYNYLLKYSNIKEKEIKYYKLYEKFFLYAVGLGIADKFEKEFKQESIENYFLTDINVLLKNNYFK